MNQWFSGFLGSIFDRCGADHGVWLSQKQTAVCVKYMNRSTVRFDADGYGTMCSHDNYTIDWNGRNVFLSYSKKNGCGNISFGMNAEEKAAHKRESEMERARIKAERIERTKRNPERLEKRLAGLRVRLENAEKTYQADLIDGDTEYLELDLEEIEKSKRK